MSETSLYRILAIVTLTFVIVAMDYFRRRYFYRKLKLSVAPLEDDDFYALGQFTEKAVPRAYAIAKRIEIAEGILDYPVARLHPGMRWGHIPLPKPFCPPEDTLIDEFHEYLASLGLEPERFLHGKTVARIIIDLFPVEEKVKWVFSREMPIGWEREIAALNRKVKDGEVSEDFIENSSVASILQELLRVREAKDGVK